MKLLLAASLCAGLMFAESAPPKLEAAFDLHLELAKPVDVGKISSVGNRRVVAVSGGTLQGPGLKGKILPGADYQIIRPDNFTEIDAHYVVQMENGDLIYINNRGMRHGPPELLAKLNAGEKVDQSQIYFRTVISVETAVPALQWMAKSILVGVGERLPNEALIHVYRVK